MKAIILIFLLFVTGCSKSSLTDRKKTPKSPQQVLDSLGPATKYYRLGEGHSTDVPVVLLVVQGGPTASLFEEGEAPQFITYYPYFTIVHVHQAQTLPSNTENDGLDARLLSGDRIISVEKARAANLKSAAILHKVAQHFKQQEKTVLVVSHSFGSWLVPHALVQYGNNFDKIVITAGRIDMPKEVYEAFTNGCAGSFDKNDTQVFVPNDCSRINFSGRVFNRRRSVGRLSGTLGQNRYSQLLKDKDISNVLYVYGTRDEQAGALSPAEIAFLKSKKVPVVALNEDHDLGDLDTYLPTTKTIKSFSEDSNAQVMHFLQRPLPSSYTLLDDPSDNTLNLYYGSANDSADDKFDIGIVFEGHSREQISYKMNSLFGDGPNSLFRTNVFKEGKSKFRIYYGKIDQSSDTSTYPTVSNNLLAQYLTKFIQAFPQASSEAHLDILLAPFFQSSQVAQSNFKTEHYMSIVDKNIYDAKNQLTNSERAHLTKIDNNIVRFSDFFNHSNNASKDFDLKIYVSPGIEKSYTDRASKIIYLEASDFINGIPSIGIHPHAFAVAGVRQLGRFVGNLAEENRDYEASSEPQSKNDLYPSATQFHNNCFSGYQLSGAKTADVKLVKILNLADGGASYYTEDDFTFDFNLVDINNPWNHSSKVPIDDGSGTVSVLTGKTISNYDGRIFPGCDGLKSFRGTQESIMRNPYRILPSNWAEKGWGAINSFYLENALEAYE